MRAMWKEPSRLGDACLILLVFEVIGYLYAWDTKTPLRRTVGVCLIAVLLLLFVAACLAARQCRRWKGLVAAGCAAALVLFLIFDFRTVRVGELPGWDSAASVSGVSLWAEGEDGVTDLRWTPDGGDWKVERTGDMVTVSGGDGAGFLTDLGEVRLRNYWWFNEKTPENVTTLHIMFNSGQDMDFYLGRDSWSISTPDGDWLPGKWYVDRPFADLLDEPLRAVIDDETV